MLTRKANENAIACAAACVLSCAGSGVVKMGILGRQTRKTTAMAWKKYHFDTPLICLVKPL